MVLAQNEKQPVKHKELPKQVDNNKNKLFDNLEEIMNRTDELTTIPVIVMLNTDFLSKKKDMEKAIGLFKTKFEYSEAFHGFAADLNKGQIIALQKMPFVQQIEYDMPVQASMDTATNWFGVGKARTDFGLDGDLDGSLTTYSKMT